MHVSARQSTNEISQRTEATMRNIEMTSIRIIRFIVLGLILGCLGARAIGVAQQSSDPTKPDLIPYRKGNQ